ncbi:MAG: ChaN family lipoprotein [Candidatus Micrarchaeota archaeon]|nr:ChaN family lipoprotein [Candidatus Micrarchaeota archaeon]
MVGISEEIYKMVEGEAEIYIIGEDHSNPEHVLREYKIIKHLQDNKGLKAVLWEAIDRPLKGKSRPSNEEIQKMTGVKVPRNEPWYLWDDDDLKKYIYTLENEISELNDLHQTASTFGETEIEKKIETRLNNVYAVQKIFISLLYSQDTKRRFAYEDIATRTPVLPCDDEGAKEKRLKIARKHDELYPKLLKLTAHEPYSEKVERRIRVLERLKEIVQELDKKKRGYDG